MTTSAPVSGLATTLAVRDAVAACPATITAPALGVIVVLNPVTTIGEAVASAKGLLADTLGIPTQYVPLALLVAVGAFLVWHFSKQRAQ